MNDTSKKDLSRRAFVQAGAVVTAGLILPSRLRAIPSSPESGVIRVGVVGCGGRGTGAVRDCLRSSDGVELVAMGDLFPDRLASSRENLVKLGTENPEFGKKLKISDERCFSGFDAYEKVIGSGIDLVILATPPGFRPQHLATAIAAGKHVFMEKPVAVDVKGIKSVFASSDLAKSKNLAIVAGTQRRHDPAYIETIKRVHGGAIGDVVAGEVYWNQGGLWHRPRKEEWTDAEWQIRNWLYFTWLSGDHIVEQHVHNIDVANWMLGAHPVRAVGVGGRQRRTDPAFGHIYDHFAIQFEYPNGARVLSMCRQIDGASRHIGERFQGTKGTTDAHTEISGANAWKHPRVERPTSPYQLEHRDLIASIRAGKPLNEGRQVAESTLSAIMGREAAYTGEAVTWDGLLALPQDLTPPTVAFGPMPVPGVPVPGVTKLVRTWNEV
jgi:myo-inositol 2-dehydrogenase / D-chiro-inositol 1-dehydrogenase